MTLTATRPSCWSGKLVLDLDGNTIGTAEPRTWTGGYDLRLTGGRRLHFGRPPGARWWCASKVAISEGGREVAGAEASGLLKQAWHVHLSTGKAVLKAVGFWNRAHLVVPVPAGDMGVYGGSDAPAEPAPVAELDWLTRKQSGAAGGWRVRTPGDALGDGSGLTPTDLLLIGLTFQTLQNRQAAAAGAAGAG